MTDLIVSFLFPFPLCVFAFALSVPLLVSARRRKLGVILASSATFVLVVCGTSLVPTLMMSRLESAYPALLEGPDFAARTAGVHHVVILGGTMVNNPRLPISSRPNPTPLVRAVEAVRVHRLLPGSRIVTSGHGGGSVSEAEIMAQLLVAVGVRAEDIDIDAQSSSTSDEATAIQRRLGSARFVLVTSAAHMPRAMGLFARAGLQPIAAPTDHFVKRPLRFGLSAFLPRLAHFQLFEGALYEYLAQVKDRARGRM